MHTQHHSYSNYGCGCSKNNHVSGYGCGSCGKGPTLYGTSNIAKPVGGNYHHAPSHHHKGGGHGHPKCYSSKKQCSSSYECPQNFLTATSSAMTSDPSVTTLCHHSCVEHNWNFECTLADSCGKHHHHEGHHYEGHHYEGHHHEAEGKGVNGSNDNGGVSFSNLDGSSESVPGSGVPNLGRYLISRDNNEAKVRVGSFNFNSTGLAVSLWLRTNNVGQSEAQLISKVDSDGTDIQSHVVSAQLVGANLRFRLKLGSDLTTGTTEWMTTSAPVQADTWHHIVFWYDGCEVKIYVDGNEQEVTEGAGTPFADVKGQAVFQGEQPVALASLPAAAATDPQWQHYAGDLDQVVVWNYPITSEVITALYNEGNGALKVPEAGSVSSAMFDACRVQLKSWSGNLCLETCFVDEDLCTLFDQCGTIALLVTNCGRCRTVLVPATNLNGWPGSLETLDSKLVGDKRVYTLRLGLKFDHCPVELGAGDQVDFLVNRGNFIKTPTPDFVITGRVY